MQRGSCPRLRGWIRRRKRLYPASEATVATRMRRWGALRCWHEWKARQEGLIGLGELPVVHGGHPEHWKERELLGVCSSYVRSYSAGQWSGQESESKGRLNVTRFLIHRMGANRRVLSKSPWRWR